MSGKSYTQDGRIGKLSTGLGKDKLLLTGLTATERLSESYSVTVEAFAAEPVSLHDILGTWVGVSFSGGEDEPTTRDFAGLLWEYAELGQDHRGHLYRLTLRPQVELLTLNRRSRVFQNKSVIDTLKAVLVNANAEWKISGAYLPVEYCVQYQESDLDFASRLMEYEGIYYYYVHEGMGSRITIVDERNTHPDMKPSATRVLLPDQRRESALIWSLTERRSLGPAKVSVRDFDFEMPSNDLSASKPAHPVLGEPTGSGRHGGVGAPTDWTEGAEIYTYPGNVIYKTDDAPAKQQEFETVRRYSDIWLGAHRRRMARSFADGTLFSAKVGHRLKLELEDGTSTEYLIVGTAHDYTAPDYDSGDGQEMFLCSLELMPAAVQYRPALATPRPRIQGPQTATVVGPAGEEIFTDKYGRVKVQFHWDREGGNNEHSSCFVRVMQSVAGQSWGSFALPRMGQEVVVEFMEGDPDRPLVTGAVYNANNMPPVDLPAYKTQHGMRTRSSKGGVGFSHWWYEDKKGEEVVWFRAERDYKAHIVHADEERQYDDGSRQTTFKKGNDVLRINSGYRSETIYGNDSKTIIDGDLTDVIKKGDEAHTIEKGKRATKIKKDDSLVIEEGNRSVEIKMGNDALKVAMGNIAVNADLGKVSVEAMQSIELKVGGSSITIDQIGVKIKGTVMVDIKGVMVQTSADAMQTIKGGLVMIN